MKKLIKICAVVLMVSGMVSAANVAGWDAFVIRNASGTNNVPAISDPVLDGLGIVLYRSRPYNLPISKCTCPDRDHIPDRLSRYEPFI